MEAHFYQLGEKVLCHTFGSVKPFKAEVIEWMEGRPGVPKYFRDKNGTLITPSDVVSFQPTNAEKILDFKQFCAWLKRETDRANARLPIGVGKMVCRRRGTSILVWNSGGFENIARFYERYMGGRLNPNKADGTEEIVSYTVRFPACNTWERLLVSDYNDPLGSDVVVNIVPIAETARVGGQRPGGSL